MKNGVKRSIYLFVGLLSLVLGVVGIFLPLLPTTPFVLLSAFCFARSSDRLYQWLLSQKGVGEIVSDWEQYRVIRRRDKWIATLMLTGMLTVSIYAVPLSFNVSLAVVAIGVFVLTFIWSCRSIPEGDPGE